LLTFSHVDREELSKNDLIQIIDKSINLISHHLEIKNIKLKKDYSVKELLIKVQSSKNSTGFYFTIDKRNRINV